MSMRIAVAGDHAGFPYKDAVLRALREDGHQPEDFGPASTDPVDYPDYARLVGLAVRDGRAELGVLICGSGAGVSIAANKIRGVRAALCHDRYTARQAREDDDANVLCLGARVVSLPEALELTRIFVGARFSGEARHARRLAKMLALEAAELPVEGAVETARRRLERAQAGARLWKKDGSLWSDVAAVGASIQNRLGWLGAPAAMRPHVADLAGLVEALRRQGFTDAVLLGMGGSSLAAEVLARTFPPGPAALSLAILDTTDPGAVRATRDRLKLDQTLFLVSSKSGTTAETLALYRCFRAEVERRVERPGDHFVAITDAGAPLERLAAEGRFRRTFLNAADIGGRFSALSFFGLVPGALAGVDVARLLDRAAAMATACGPAASVDENPGLALAAALGGLAGAGRDKVTLFLSPPIRSLGAWLEQLVTESTGKHGRGLVVVHEEPPAAPDTYGADRVFVAISLGDDPALERAVAPLEAAGHPVVRLRLADRFDLGAEFFRWEVATAAVGVLLGLNPFDEPNVAQAKEATQAALATFEARGRLPDGRADSAEDAARVLGQARPGDYVGLLAYLAPEPATTAALQSLRVLLRERTRLATTVGYGPRYLHSTGQLHKGGPPTPILIVLTAEPGEDVPIPGERYGFATLERAQALGDLATLRAAQRRVVWLRLDGLPAPAIERLTATLAAKLR
ncbi:MAG: RpiB/LacA/LacB family sugar-phosphate isomerase [Candidatus Rokubacteria bacterium]|nr:RpiB/LacA/LacB family sugar-phosphate isomerase [Candidatus Rokubacteria bacterium]